MCLSARRNRGRHGLALAVFPARFSAPLALSLAAQHFQVSVYKVFLIDPALNSPPAWHLQLTRCTGYLFRRPGSLQLFLVVGGDVVHSCGGSPATPC